MGTIIKFTNISKKFHCPHRDEAVLADISLHVNQGDILGIIGPSGCGKTTLLRIIADLDKCTQGTMVRNYSRLSFVFQELRIMPWLSVYDHLKLILKNSRNIGKKSDKRYSKEYIDHKIYQVLKIVGLSNVAKVRGGKLSGGMKKRVELARALIIDPDLILFDEPLANVDYFLRYAILNDIKQILTEQNKTSIYVTHDIREAIYLCNRIILMSPSPARILKEFVNLHELTPKQSVNIEQEIMDVLGFHCGNNIANFDN